MIAVAALIFGSVIIDSEFTTSKAADPTARGTIGFATFGTLATGVSLVGLLMFLALLFSEVTYLVSGTVPEFVLTQHRARVLTDAEGLILCELMVNAFTGGGLLMALRRRNQRRRDSSLRTNLPNLNAALAKLAERLSVIALSVAGYSLIFLFLLLLFEKLESLASQFLVSYPIWFFAALAMTTLTAALCTAMTWLIVLPLRFVLSARLLYRLTRP
jgi:hypothetical protein